MASTVKVKDVLWQCSTLLLDSATQFQRFPELALVQRLNLAQVAIAKFLPMSCARVDAIKLVAGTRQSIEAIPSANCKPGDGSTPSATIYGTALLAVVRAMGSDGLTPGNAIRLVESKMLDRSDPEWHTKTADFGIKGYAYDERTPRYFYVTPGAFGTEWIEARYYAQPLPIPAGGAPGSEVYLNSGASTQTITIADEYMDELINYVVGYSNLIDSKYGDPAKAKFHIELFTGAIDAKVKALMGTSPNLKDMPVPTPGAPQ
jgi:hypothetical protein